MVMFLSVGLVRSMSMFMYDLNLQMWKKKEKHCVLYSGPGALGLSWRKRTEQQNSKLLNSIKMRLSMTFVLRNFSGVQMDETDDQVWWTHGISACKLQNRWGPEREMGWDSNQTVNLLFMHDHVAFPSGRCNTCGFRCVI